MEPASYKSAENNDLEDQTSLQRHEQHVTDSLTQVGRVCSVYPQSLILRPVLHISITLNGPVVFQLHW